MSLGRHLRLTALHINEIPEHERLHSFIDLPHPKTKPERGPENGYQRPELHHFVTSVLQEASAFTQERVPRTFSLKGTKTVPPSSNKVDILTHHYSSKEITSLNLHDTNLPRHRSGVGTQRAEHWFARRSRHPNYSEKGAATFEEFDYGLRKDHSVHEMEYTPDVYDCPELFDWDQAIETAVSNEGPIPAATDSANPYTHVRMGIREMCHKLPRPLSPRTFPVLVLTAREPSSDSFIVVQIPVDVSTLTDARYSNRRNMDGGKIRWWRAKPLQYKKTVIGLYASVEHVRLIRERQEIEWTMATTSDAKGRLPMWMQKLGVPGAIVKDVSYFLSWINKGRGERRRNQTENSSILKQSTQTSTAQVTEPSTRRVGETAA